MSTSIFLYVTAVILISRRAVRFTSPSNQYFSAKSHGNTSHHRYLGSLSKCVTFWQRNYILFKIPIELQCTFISSVLAGNNSLLHSSALQNQSFQTAASKHGTEHKKDWGPHGVSRTCEKIPPERPPCQIMWRWWFNSVTWWSQGECFQGIREECRHHPEKGNKRKRPYKVRPYDWGD